MRHIGRYFGVSFECPSFGMSLSSAVFPFFGNLPLLTMSLKIWAKILGAVVAAALTTSAGMPSSPGDFLSLSLDAAIRISSSVKGVKPSFVRSPGQKPPLSGKSCDITLSMSWGISRCPGVFQEVKFGTDESKRQAPLKQADALFGVEGSFRKLDVD